MSLLNFFRKDSLNEEKRVIYDAPNEEDRVEVESRIPILGEAEAKELMEFLKSIIDIGKKREELYEEFEEMECDSVISGAMDILSDDIVRKDFIHKKRFWASPIDITDKDAEMQRVVDKVNQFLEDFSMDTKASGYAYDLLKYGEVFLKTYVSEIEEGEISNEFKSRDGYLYEKVLAKDHVALEKYGIDVGFGEVKRDDKGKERGYKIYDSEDFIHIINDKKGKRESKWIKTDDEGDKEEFKVKIGTSYLDSVRQAWQIISLIETLLLYVRFGRSGYYRLVQVEVGSSTKTEAMKILRNVKRKLENQDSLNLNTRTYRGDGKPIPHNDNVYLATKQGKGEVTITPVGGEVDIKDVVDLDYWVNKLFSALAIPKAYLGFSDDNLTGLNNQSLTRQDIRYCRTVENFNEVLLKGVKDICDHYLKRTGDEDYVDSYKIEGAKILSAETTDRQEDIRSRIDLTNALYELLGSMDGVDVNEIVPILLDAILDIEDICSDLSGLTNKKDGEEDEGESN